MKKLNRKGFTLIELLAVIVILAIVMVVTIPSVLRTMDSARDEQFKNAVLSIQEYVQKNYDLCKIGGVLVGSNYDTTIFTTSGDDNCVPAAASVIIPAAGYKTSDIATDGWAHTVTTNGKYIITAAKAGTNGQFKGAADYSNPQS